VDHRNEAVQTFVALPLMDRRKSPLANPLPESSVASVVMDGGRQQILGRGKRRAEAGETADDKPIDRNRHWREDKIGLLMTMTNPVSSENPCPEIPENFIDPKRMFKLVSEIKGHVGDPAISQLSCSNPKACRRTTVNRARTPIRGPSHGFVPWSPRGSQPSGSESSWLGRLEREAFLLHSARHSSPVECQSTGRFTSSGLVTTLPFSI
jgi:hypothetical protein